MAEIAHKAADLRDQPADRAEQIGSALAWIVITALLVMFTYGYVPNF